MTLPLSNKAIKRFRDIFKEQLLIKRDKKNIYSVFKTVLIEKKFTTLRA